VRPTATEPTTPIPKILDPHSPDEGAIFSAFAAVLS
jgi:hypothetical protein